MKKNLLSFLFILSASVFLSAQPVFQKAYGGPTIDGAWSVRQTSDGGYIITAETNSYSSGGDAVYLVKTDSLGIMQWTKTFGGLASFDYGNMVQQTIDGGYIITGMTFSFGSGNGDVYVVKTDANGNQLWSKTYGGIDLEEGYSIRQTVDTGYIIAGFTQSYGHGESDAYLIKTDTAGNVMWSQTYGGVNSEGYQGTGNISVHQTFDGGYILTAYTNSFTFYYDLYMVRINPTGGVIWSRTYGGTADEYGYANGVGQTGDGGFIMTGLTRSFGSGQADVYLVKVNANGNLLWSKTYGGVGEDYGYSVQQVSTGGYIITGTTHSFGASYQVYLIRTDMTGNLLWSKTYGGIYDDRGYCVEEASDGGFIIAGYTSSYGSGSSDIYLIKTDANGNSGCNETTPVTLVTTPATVVTLQTTLIDSGCVVTVPATLQGIGGIETVVCIGTTGIDAQTLQPNSISIFPNPTNGIFTIDVKAEISAIEIYNLLGEKVAAKSVNTDKVKLDLSDQPGGVYFIRCLIENKIIAVEKLVITE